MQCYQPISIPNKGHYVSLEHGRLYNLVPCGKCGACRHNQVQQYKARAYYDAKYTQSVGGFVYFQTFTYAEDKVPMSHGFRCFNTKHYVLFMMRLRTKLGRAGYDIKDKLGVLWSSEYGTKYTKRPHYHALFFVNFKITPEEFDKFLCNCWEHGFTQTNVPCASYTPRKCVVKPADTEGMSAIGYVSKYICKDFDFMEENGDAFKRFIENEKSKFNDDYPYDGSADEQLDYLSKFDAKIHDLVNDYRTILPFHRQSNGFGIHIMDYVSSDDLDKGVISLPADKFNQSIEFVPVPQYIDRKRLYVYNPDDKCYHITKEGLTVKNERMCYNSGNVKLYYADIYTNIYNMLNYESCDDYGLHYNTRNVFHLGNLLKSKVDSLLNGRTLEDLALYKLYFRNRVVRYDLKIEEFEIDMMQPYIDSTFDEVITDEPSSFDFEYVDKYVIFNKCPCFSGFDEACDILDGVNTRYRQAMQREYIRQKRLQSKYDSIYKQF